MTDSFDQMFRRLHHLVNQGDPFAPPAPGASARWRPFVDVYETNESIIVVMDVAGVEPDGIDIQVEGRRLLVRGTRVKIAPARPQRIHHLEIPHGEFYVAVDLPAAVDLARADAGSHNGLLEIVLPFPVTFRPAVRSADATRTRSGE